jgi:hypothetical protein
VTLYERFEKASELDMTRSTRRRVLARAAKACLGLAVGAAGLSRVERARAQGSRIVGCCSLAYDNDCPHCTGQGYDCASGCTRWAWYCVDNMRRYWICGECYSGGTCSGCSCGTIVSSAGRHFPTLTGPS